jgi:hypothetical protein
VCTGSSPHTCKVFPNPLQARTWLAIDPNWYSKGQHLHLVSQNTTLATTASVSHYTFVQKLHPLDLMWSQFSRKYGIYYHRGDVQLPVINQVWSERSEHPMRTSGSQKDELGIEFGLVFSCGNDHHYRILSVWVVPMTLRMS